MTEGQSSATRGYNIDSALARQEIYRLLCYLYSSKHIADLDRPLLNLLCCDFEETEVTRTLINTAISVRLFLDSDDEEPSSNTELTAGELTPDVNAPQNTVALRIREACNKIIHAREIIFETGTIGHTPYANTYVLPKITLFGERGQTRWKAVIDIPRFAESACDVLPL